MTKTILLAAAALALAGGARAASMFNMDLAAADDRDPSAAGGGLRVGMAFDDYDFSLNRMAMYSALAPKPHSVAIEPWQSGEPGPAQSAPPSPIADAAQGAVAVLQSLQSSVQTQRQSGAGASPTPTQTGQGGESQGSPGLVAQGGQGQGSQGQGAQGNQGQGGQGSQTGGGSGAQGAVPEISTWAMLLAGVGMIGIALRRRASAGLKA